jgi:hypothetical protein
MKEFKVGQTVRWSSGAGNGYKSKTGTIVFIVPSEGKWHCPVNHQTHRIMFDSLCFGRGHVSYLVEVSAGPRAKPKLYWPRTVHLELAP